MHSGHTDGGATPRAAAPARLKRALGLWLLVGYGLGITIGAGIYVLVGSVARAAGNAAPLSFLLAGAAAALIGVCYAELATRFPEAAGTPAYVKHAFGSDGLSRLAGFAVGAVLALSTASIARGCAGYVQTFADLPTPVIAALAVGIGTVVACFGVRQGVGFATAMTLIELGGLALVLAAAAAPALDAIDRAAALFAPAGASGWQGVAHGAFLAFFAFIGFENLANMAEETKVPERTLPRAILVSLALSTAIYVAVTAGAVLAVAHDALVGSDAPLLLVVAGSAWFSPRVFAAIALIAVGNGVLLELIALARLIYGMARRGWLPQGLAQVRAASQAPMRATLLGGALVMALAVGLPFVSLVELTSMVTLLIFAVVAAALWRLHRVAPKRTGFRAPRLVPPLALAASLALMIGALVD